jgi:hypothetical protein
LPGGTVNYAVTASTTLKVYAKETTTLPLLPVVSTSPVVILPAGRVGYLVVEVCYVQPDVAPQYEDIEGYLTNRTVS